MAETKKKQQREFTLALPVGTVLHNGQYQYRIEEVLGQGNYGITYKASAMVKIGNISKPMTFAIKENFAKAYCSRNPDGVTMSYSSNHAEETKRDLNDFVAEGKTLAQICNGHKNIVNVNETFEENKTAYYVMEFIEGGNLCDLVKSKGRLTENEAIQILVPIVDAVSHMHKNRRLHLDIKPENIMLKKDGTPILIDFGITLHFNANGGLTGTSKDRSGGLSEGYAPMEQYSGVTTFAPEIDVYALGATLYYMLVGKDPAKASDISTKKIEAALPLDISEITRSSLLHAMRKLAEDRTPSADEFLKELGQQKPKQKEGKEREPESNPSKTHKYKKEEPKDEPSLHNIDSGNLSFWGELKDAHNKRSWKASLLLYLGFIGSLLLLLVGQSWIYNSILYDNNLMFMGIMCIIPAFLFVELLVGKKWAFGALFGVGIVITLNFVILEWSSFIPLSFFGGGSFYLLLLWYSLHDKIDGEPYWNMMDSKLFSNSIFVSILCIIFLCGYTIYLGERNRNKQMNESASLYHDDYSQAIKKVEEMVEKYENSKVINEKIDDLLVAKEAYTKAIEYEKKWQNIQPAFYSKVGGVQFPLFNYLQELVDSCVVNLDVLKVTDYPRTIGIMQHARELYPDNESLNNMYKTVISDAAYMKIKNIQFKNYNNGETINNYGERLYSKHMRYLGSKISYDGLADDISHSVLNIKIISPFGKLEQWSGSPKNYSFSDTLTVYQDKDSEVTLKGWGSHNESIYERGKWRYEIWHNNKKIYSTTFTIN